MAWISKQDLLDRIDILENALAHLLAGRSINDIFDGVTSWRFMSESDLMGSDETYLSWKCRKEAKKIRLNRDRADADKWRMLPDECKSGHAKKGKK